MTATRMRTWVVGALILGALGFVLVRGLGDATLYFKTADEAELAAAIRAGALDDRYDEVVGFVRQTVRAKLEVANPKYLES